ncbi:MAG: CpsD/CapB family tyrosine-protein kinase [Candidatus Acidiferrales bacterium]
MSRVFDALQKTGGQAVSSTPASPAKLIDALEKGFRLESLPTARMQLGPESRLIFHTDPTGPGAERYRLLRIRLQAIRAEAPVKIVLITSPGPQEGKSTLALNLAAALAEKKNQSVLLLEGDLRCPTLARELGLTLPYGLTQCSRSDAALQSVIWKIDPLGFHLLPAGKSINNPVEILNSEWFAEATEKLASSFDWILIDSPPAIPVVDTLSLKARADATLIVARAGRTQQSAIDDAVRILGQDHILGLVLNAVEKFDRGYYEYYRHYAPEAPANGKRKS